MERWTWKQNGMGWKQQLVKKNTCGLYYKNILTIVSDDGKLRLYYKCASPQPQPMIQPQLASSIMIASDAPNCGITYDRHYDDHNSFTIQATEYFEYQINRINGLSIKRNKSWVDLKFFTFTGASSFILMTKHLITEVTFLWNKIEFILPTESIDHQINLFNFFNIVSFVKSTFSEVPSIGKYILLL